MNSSHNTNSIINVYSIGGTAMSYGNVFDSSRWLSNFVVDHFCQYLREKTNNYIDIIYNQPNDSLEIGNTKNTLCAFIFVDLVNFDFCEILAKRLKESSIPVILFGHVISSYYSEIRLSFKYADFLILGDPEYPGVRLINYITQKKEEIIDDPNIIDLKCSLYTLKHESICKDIERWPCFDFYKLNTEYNYKKTHCMALKNAVCYCHCSFCWSKKGSFQYKNAKRFVDEIILIVEKFRVKDFYFTDNDFFDIYNEQTANLLKDIFRRIIDSHVNISFFIFSKCRSITKDKIELLRLMKCAGLYCIFLGVDVGNEKDRLLYKKTSSLNHSRKAIILLQKLNIWYRCGFISLNPYSTLETLRENFLFLKGIQSSNFYHYGGLKVMLFKNTPLFFKVQNDNLLAEDYSFRNIYSYKYKNSEIIPYVEFLDKLFNKINTEIKIPYLAVRRWFEKAMCVSPNLIKQKEEMNKYSKEQFEIITSFFEKLFLENDLDFCQKELSNFVNDLNQHSAYFKNKLKEFQSSYQNASIYK